MNDRRFFLGTAVTITWIVVMAWVVLRNPAAANAMKPNEWGDFFAGFFAPLAFLWLVLGYMQQGQELQLSTQALLLQADELRNSVQQQKELVEVTRLQVESDRETLQLERISRREAAQPRFVLTNHGGSFSGDGKSSYSIAIANAGNTATRVVGALHGISSDATLLFQVSMFGRGTECKVELGVTQPFPAAGANLQVEYLDADGTPGAASFLVNRQSSSEQSMLSFSPSEG